MIVNASHMVIKIPATGKTFQSLTSGVMTPMWILVGDMHEMGLSTIYRIRPSLVGRFVLRIVVLGFHKLRSIILVNASHMVIEIPATGKTFQGSVTSGVMTPIWIISVGMHGMSLSPVAEETSIRRKFKILTISVLASIGFQVGIQVFATLVR
jgi:uncharacterized membrane protein YcfT